MQKFTVKLLVVLIISLIMLGTVTPIDMLTVEVSDISQTYVVTDVWAFDWDWVFI